MVEYGVNVTNKFAFLGDDEEAHDPAEILAKTEREVVEKEKLPKTALKKTAAALPAVHKPNVLASVNNKENIGRGSQVRTFDRRAGPPGPRTDKPRGSRRQDDGAPAAGDLSDRFGETRPPRNGPRGPRREGGNWNRDGRGPRTPRNENGGDQDNAVAQENADGRRGFRGPRQPRTDRISGSDRTGVRAVPKKDGHGKGNWGTELETEGGELNKSATEGSEPVPAGENAENADALNTDQEKQQQEEEAEQLRQLTLEEWKAQQKQVQPNFNLRKAGEGGDQKIYSKLVLVKPVENKTAEEDEEDANQNKREKREKTLNIDVSFVDRNRGGGGGYHEGRRDNRPPRGSGPGNRQGGNGGNFRGGPRNDQGTAGPSGSGRRPAQHNSFNLTADAFPALGAS